MEREQSAQEQQPVRSLPCDILLWSPRVSLAAITTTPTSTTTTTKIITMSWLRPEILLQVSAEQGDHEQVARFLDQGVDVNWHHPGFIGCVPLHRAADRGHESCVRLLLDRHADVNAMDDNRWTALHYTVWGGHEACVRLLLDRHASVNATDFDQQTPLSLCAVGGHVSVARLLLDRRADINAADDSHRTPLYVAARNDHESVVRLFLERGADATIVSVRRRCPCASGDR